MYYVSFLSDVQKESRESCKSVSVCVNGRSRLCVYASIISAKLMLELFDLCQRDSRETGDGVTAAWLQAAMAVTAFEFTKYIHLKLLLLLFLLMFLRADNVC